MACYLIGNNYRISRALLDISCMELKFHREVLTK